MNDESRDEDRLERSGRTAPYFHTGERRIQAESGVDSGGLEALGPQIMDPELAGHEIAFVEGRTFSAAATVDGAGRPWISALFGQPGDLFAVRDAVSLDIRPSDDRTDLLRTNIDATGALGVLFFDPSTRRRAKSLGTGTVVDAETIRYTMTRYFGLCPKYIFRRTHEPSRSKRDDPGETSQREELGDADWRQLTASDTIFLASYHEGHGADATHRGGRRGFVRVLDAATIEIPDYVGNGMFNTIGNLLLDARLGLTDVDFQTGRTLQITGTTSVSRTPDMSVHGEAARVISLHIEEVRASSIDAGTWTDLEPSRYSMNYPGGTRNPRETIASAEPASPTH